jgi:hypothetical protein
MLNSVFTTIFNDELGEIDVQIVAEHPNNMIDFNSARIYSIWNGDDHPLGMFTLVNGELNYEGVDLDESGIEQLTNFINAYSEGEWDL